MQATEGASATSGAPESNHAQFQTAVLDALAAITGQIAGLAERVEKVERESGPHFVPASPESYDRDINQQDTLDNLPLDGIPRSTHLPVFPNGERVPDFVMKQYRPKFGTGSRVRLNLDAVPHGRSDGKTRGQLMREEGVPNGIGEVFSAMYHTEQGGGWKCRVRFAQRTMP